MFTNQNRQIVVVLITAGLTAGLYAQEQPAIEIQTTHISENVYMLAGVGGNLGVSVGDDGALLIDSEYAPLTDKVTAAVKEICQTPIRLLINTHWHFDHVGGNENLAKAGVLIIAHENVRKLMSTEQVLAPMGRRVPPSPAQALPVITYTDTLTLHRNGDVLNIIHVEPAHTNGDSIIHFRKANVVHMGDIYFNGMYPFIDVNAGGSIDGMIKAIDRALTLMNDNTKIIPGHGPLSNVTELRAYRTMLASVRDRVRTLVEQGKTREQVVASQPTKDFDAQWGQGGFAPDMWVGIVYDGMSRNVGQDSRGD